MIMSETQVARPFSLSSMPLFYFGITLYAALFLTSGVAEARLPKPSQDTGVIFALDLDTHSLVFKASKREKPFVLDWNNETQFFKGERGTDATKLKVGDAARIEYTHISFRNPMLKKVFVLASRAGRYGRR